MGTRTRLAVMMALAYAVQGAWWPVLSVHLKDLGVSGRGRGWIFATLAIAALISPPLAGRIADRRLSAQKLLAILYAIGSVLLAVMASGRFVTFSGLFPLFLVYWLLIIPYLGLINTVAMRNLESPSTQFGGIRLWGTVGWMVVGWLVSAVMWAREGPSLRVAAHESFLIGSGISAVLAVFCLFLPDTPPLASGRKGLPIKEAVEMLRRPGVLVLLIAGFGVSLTTPFVYQAVPAYLYDIGMPRNRIASAMTLGQVPEILMLGILPLVLERLGRRNTMILGIGAWIAYHGAFAMQPGAYLALLVIPLNGVAIALFHITAPMYLDSQAPPDRRAGMQGLWVMTTSGLGSLVGGLLAGEVMERASSDWRLVFAIPAGIAACFLAVFVLAFWPKSASAAEPRTSFRPCGAGVAE